MAAVCEPIQRGPRQRHPGRLALQDDIRPAEIDLRFSWRQQQISHQTIYTWIRTEDAAGRDWRRYLQRLGRKRPEAEKRGKILASVSIEGRPAVVN